MGDETRVLPFQKPTQRVRLDHLTPEERRAVFDDLLDMVARAEGYQDVVGWCLVLLCDDGKRRSDTRCQRQAEAQLAKQVRREAAEITRKAGEEWPA